MNMGEEKTGIISWIDGHLEEYYRYSDTIWSFPELGFAEFQSSRLLMDFLKSKGFSVDESVGGMPTAFVANWGTGKPVIAINCEYDALPGLSQGETSDKQPIIEGAPGHGCGHNLLGVGAIMAAVAIQEWLKLRGMEGTVRIFGTPAEENGAGKAYMARAGLFEGMDACIDWHPFYYNSANYDTCNSFFSMRYHFQGRTAHGNAPWNGRSAVDTAVLMGHAIEMLREHIPPGLHRDAAHTINYTFPELGPESPTVVPDRSTLWVVGRITTHEEMLDVVKRVDKCAEGAAIATGTSWRKVPVVAIHEKIPNRTLSEVMYRNFEAVGSPRFDSQEHEFAKKLQRSLGAKEVGLQESILEFGEGASIVSDNAEYSWIAPFAMIWVVTAPPGIGWHNWQVTASVRTTIGKKGMTVAAKVLATSAVELFLEPRILEAAKTELQERLAGRNYRCLIPEDVAPPIDLNLKTMEKYLAAMNMRSVVNSGHQTFHATRRFL